MTLSICTPGSINFATWVWIQFPGKIFQIVYQNFFHLKVQPFPLKMPKNKLPRTVHKIFMTYCMATPIKTKISIWRYQIRQHGIKSNFPQFPFTISVKWFCYLNVQPFSYVNAKHQLPSTIHKFLVMMWIAPPIKIKNPVWPYQVRQHGIHSNCIP